MSWFLSNSITDPLLQPLEILVKESLLLQDHIFGLAQLTRSVLQKDPEAIGFKIVLLSGLVDKRWEMARLNLYLRLSNFCARQSIRAKTRAKKFIGLVLPKTANSQTTFYQDFKPQNYKIHTNRNRG